MKTQQTLRQLLLLPLLSLMAAGCGIPSVHPLYEPHDLIVRPELTGTWRENDDTAYRVYNLHELRHNAVLRDSLGIKEDDAFLQEFADRGLDRLYLVAESDIGREDADVFLAGLLQIGDAYYLDLYRYKLFEDVFSYPVHIFVKAELAADTLRLHPFREEWIKELVRNRQIRIRHEESFDQFLLTAPPAELKAFIAKYGSDPDAYSRSVRTFTKQQADE